MKITRYDRMVTYPNLIFLCRFGCVGSVLIYAGEHFQPGQDTNNSPGAQHIASSDAIFFLFDPTINPDFRRFISDSDDPQLLSKVSDQQDIILAETEVRIKRLLGLNRNDKVDTPFAVVLGKCDSWINMEGIGEIKDPIVDGELDLNAVESNSNVVRSILEEHCPYVVANAERISSNVRYFATSAFGHTPLKFADENGVEFIAPDPSNIKPMFIEIPTMWALSKVMPEIVPSFM